MLQITIPAIELWDEQKQEFIQRKEQVLELEHSLISLRKWESKWCKAFLSKTPKTDEEVIDYIKCMTITKNVDPETYMYLTKKNIKDINQYIEAPMTATYFTEDKNQKGSREVVTAEVIYWWMISLNIPFSCEKWHINSLLSLIKVCNAKNSPPKKRGMKETINRYAALNEARKKSLNTRG